MKNKLIDLNNHLFAQLDRLNDEELKGDQLREEIDRSKAVTGVSKEIVSNARLALDAEQLKQEYGLKKAPAMLEQGNGGD